MEGGYIHECPIIIHVRTAWRPGENTIDEEHRREHVFRETKRREATIDDACMHQGVCRTPGTDQKETDFGVKPLPPFQQENEIKQEAIDQCDQEEDHCI